jgi:hypothetical protein
MQDARIEDWSITHAKRRYISLPQVGRAQIIPGMAPSWPPNIGGRNQRDRMTLVIRFFTIKTL